MPTIKIIPKSSRSNYVALDIEDKSKILAEGTTVCSTIKKAKKLNKPYIMMFVGFKKGVKYIF